MRQSLRLNQSDIDALGDHATEMSQWLAEETEASPHTVSMRIPDSLNRMLAYGTVYVAPALVLLGTAAGPEQGWKIWPT